VPPADIPGYNRGLPSSIQRGCAGNGPAQHRNAFQNVTSKSTASGNRDRRLGGVGLAPGVPTYTGDVVVGSEGWRFLSVRACGLSAGSLKGGGGGTNLFLLPWRVGYGVWWRS
jgi:hypothetical protein